MTFNMETKTEINAPLNKVWEVLSDFEQYKTWNSLTLFDKKPELGKTQIMKVKLFGRWLAVPIRIQNYSKEEGVRWRGGIASVFTGSHYFKLESLGENKTLLIQGEDFEGFSVRLALPLMKGSLNKLYAGINSDLKRVCEKERDPSAALGMTE